MPDDLLEFAYDRTRAVAYAHTWAYFRNPEFYNFNEIGGDCTNFASQCIFAGSGVMNYTPTYGWYYIDLNDRAPAWTGVIYLFNFLTTNQGVGPFGREVPMEEVRPGDIVQLQINQATFHHTPVIVAIEGSGPPSLDSIIVAAHSSDCDCRPLSSYSIQAVRFIHIEGVRSRQLVTLPPIPVPLPHPTISSQPATPARPTMPGAPTILEERPFPMPLPTQEA